MILFAALAALAAASPQAGSDHSCRNCACLSALGEVVLSPDFQPPAEGETLPAATREALGVCETAQREDAKRREERWEDVASFLSGVPALSSEERKVCRPDWEAELKALRSADPANDEQDLLAENFDAATSSRFSMKLTDRHLEDQIIVNRYFPFEGEPAPSVGACNAETLASLRLSMVGLTRIENVASLENNQVLENLGALDPAASGLDDSIWLIAQHADTDPFFQGKAAQAFAEAAEAGLFDPQLAKNIRLRIEFALERDETGAYREKLKKSGWSAEGGSISGTD